MNRSALVLFGGLLMLSAVLLLGLNGCGGSGGLNPPLSLGKIDHVLVIFQENRTRTIFFMIQF